MTEDTSIEPVGPADPVGPAEPVGPADPVEVVEAFCDAVGRRDLARCRSLLGRDVVYHNIPLDPIEGIEATMEALEGMFSMFGDIAFRLQAVAADGDVVLTERIDAFDVGGTEVALPVMGAFEVRNGRIAAWRDYFDVGQAGRLMSPGPEPEPEQEPNPQPNPGPNREPNPGPNPGPQDGGDRR